MTKPLLLCYRLPIKLGFGVKSVKTLRFAVALLWIGSLAGPAASQFASASSDMIKAVRARDGGKLNQLLRDNPAGIVNARDSNGDTPLIITIARQDEWAGFFINKGADPNIAGKGGDTPLITAARVGYYDAVNWLLTSGAKVDLANRMGETPLIIAVQQRQIPIIKRLLLAGADPDKKDSAAGYSARDYAERDARSRQIVQLIEEKKPKKPASAAQ